MIDQYEHFVKTGYYKTVEGILIKLDEIIGMHSIGPNGNPCYQTLLSNEESFRKVLGDFIMLVIKQNLEDCTVEKDCEHYGNVGTIPKWKGEPTLSHIIHQIRPKAKQDLVLRDRDGQE